MENVELNDKLIKELTKQIDDEIIKGVRKSQINSFKELDNPIYLHLSGNYNKETSDKYFFDTEVKFPKDYFKPFIIDLA